MLAPASPEHAAIITKLESALARVPMGGSVSYSELNRIAGRDVRDRHRHLLTRARELAERQLGCCFESVRGVGILRVSSESLPDIGLAAIRRCRTAARRGKKRIDRVNPNSLSESDQRRMRGLSAMLGAVAMISDGRKAAAIGAVADPAKPIPPKNILDMFRD